MGDHSKDRGYDLTGPSDTIAAIATPVGRGGIGVVRVSGPDAQRIAKALVSRSLEPRYATHATFLDEAGQALDRGIAIAFTGPHSYTGEDMLELQAHGSPVVLRALLESIYAAGARPAEPGEFTRRAFLNGKLDLAQAEAVADLIEATTARAARAALRTLEGQFSRSIVELDGALAELRAYVEAAMDFPEEDVDLLESEELAARVARLRSLQEQLLGDARRGALLNDGIDVVIAGEPNVGKSSLLNRLAARDAAIVTPVPGTTRDLVRETLSLGGVAARVTDTAGVRSARDAVEREGVARARAAVRAADLVLLVCVDGEPDCAPAAVAGELPDGVPVILARNKIDLNAAAPGLVPPAQRRLPRAECEVRLSAATGAGIEALVEALIAVVACGDGAETDFTVRARHLDALRDMSAAVRDAQARLVEGSAPELVAEELRRAQHALARVVGERDNESLLGLIFSKFCIGK